MKTRIQLRQRATKLRAALLTATMGALLLSGNAAAQWTVIDPTHIKTQLAEFAKEAARWGEQGRQWYKEYQQFMQQYNSFLSSIQNMQSAFGLPPQGVPLERIRSPDTFMVTERCGEPYGGGTAGILGRLTGFSIGDNPQQKRWEYCASLQRMRNTQFNEMVDYLQQTMPQMSSELNSAGNQFLGSGKTQGDMSAYAAKLDKVKGDMAKSNEEFNARMQAYDTYAKATEINMGSLTRSTMRGGAGLIQQVTNAAIMRERLCGGGQCD